MSTPLLAALQAALAAEQEIVYGYGVAGAQLAGSDQFDAVDAWNRHRARRDELAALISAEGGTPAAPRAAYSLPFPVRTEAAARRLIGHLEAGGAGAAWNLAEAGPASSPSRRLAVSWLSASATDGATFTGRVAALPGSPPSG